jgi:hypothetical protein
MKVRSKIVLVLALAVLATCVSWGVRSFAITDAIGSIEFGGATNPAVEILGRRPIDPAYPLSIVRHRWQVKIARSNHVAIRPGSVYDIVTYFEQNVGTWRPRFNYLFLDTGLGTADPIYPIFQRGRQASWAQLLPAMLSDRYRHIDHESVADTPEGCRVYSSYWVRHINEFPALYARERADGYTLVDISFNYYVKRRPDAQCGRHRAHEPEPGFDPLSAIRPYAERFESYDQIPPPLLARYETKIGLLKLVKETFDRDRWPRFIDQYRFRRNSLWYYPDGARPARAASLAHSGGGHALSAGQLLFERTPGLAARFPLTAVLPERVFARYLDFLDGRPVPDFDPASEPGGDAVGLGDIRPENFLTSGLDVIPLGSPGDVRKLVGDPNNYRLVSILVRPYQLVEDRRFAMARVVPQIRFVYQLHLPGKGGEGAGKGRPVEQLFLHLNFDAVDRLAPQAERDRQHRQLLDAVARVALQRGSGDPGWEATVGGLAAAHISPDALARVSFSSSLTGLWVFGNLSRARSPDGSLEPERVVREGIDVGYYSSAYDTTLFRKALATATGPRRDALAAHLAALTPKRYRDPRRSDPDALRFARMTCAQCHHMAGRDAIHVALNDGLDRRFIAPVRYSRFVMHELDRQLTEAEAFLSKARRQARRE